MRTNGKMSRAGRQARRTQPYRRQAKRQFNRTLAKMKRGRAAAGSAPTRQPARGQLANKTSRAARSARRALGSTKRPTWSKGQAMTTKQRQATRRTGKGTNMAQERRRKRAGKSYDSSLLRRRKLRRL